MSRRPTTLFGGTFDPPHMGHVLSVAWLLSALEGDVWVEPVDTHILGKQSTDFATRLAWCRQAFAIFGRRVAVRSDERRPGSVGATIDLVRHLQALHPERAFRLAIGSDIWAERAKWRDFNGLMDLVPLVVLRRPGHALPPDVPALVSPVEFPDESASAVRAELAAGKSLRGRVPLTVLAAMGAHG